MAYKRRINKNSCIVVMNKFTAYVKIVLTRIRGITSNTIIKENNLLFNLKKFPDIIKTIGKIDSNIRIR
jgi:uncharacterized membrane protein